MGKFRKYSLGSEKVRVDSRREDELVHEDLDTDGEKFRGIVKPTSEKCEPEMCRDSHGTPDSKCPRGARPVMSRPPPHLRVRLFTRLSDLLGRKVAERKYHHGTDDLQGPRMALVRARVRLSCARQGS